jgi:hypothetical protein
VRRLPARVTHAEVNGGHSVGEEESDLGLTALPSTEAGPFHPEAGVCFPGKPLVSSSTSSHKHLFSELPLGFSKQHQGFPWKYEQFPSQAVQINHPLQPRD